MENLDIILLKALGRSIIQSIWMGAFIYSLLLILIRLIRPTPGLRSWLAHSSQLLMLCLFAYSVASFINTTKALTTDQMGDQNMVGFIVAPQNVILPQNVISPQNAILISQHIESFIPVVALLYLLGLILYTVSLLWGFRQLRALRRHGLQQVPDTWLALLEHAKHRLGIQRHIDLFLSSKVTVPVLIGHIRPVLLFPVALYTHLDIQQVESIVLHELAHIKRHDYLWNILKIITETLLFFNPFVWWISKIIEQEREYACDDMVIGLTSKPIEYSHTLLTLELLRQKTGSKLAMQALGHRKQLLQRIQRITHTKNTNLHPGYRWSFFSLLALCLLLLIWPKLELSDQKEITVASYDQNLSEPQELINNYIDSIRNHFTTTEWKEKTRDWSHISKESDTTFLMGSMTLSGSKRDAEQFLETTRLLRGYAKIQGHEIQRLKKEFENEIEETQTYRVLHRQLTNKFSDGFIALNRIINEEMKSSNESL